MSLLKKLLCFCLILIFVLLTGCNTKNNEIMLPESKPNDFNLVFNYGVNAKNRLDTASGLFVKDMVMEPSITSNLNLSDEEMNYIYSEIRRISILDYPEDFEPAGSMMQTPYETYYLEITIDGNEKTISWTDENASDTKEAVALRDLFSKIKDMIVSKEEYRILPAAQSAYQ